jgi:hypothetical protein
VLLISRMVLLANSMIQNPLGGEISSEGNMHCIQTPALVIHLEMGHPQALCYAIASNISIEVTLFPRMTYLQHQRTYLGENLRSCNVRRCQSGVFAQEWSPLGHHR